MGQTILENAAEEVTFKAANDQLEIVDKNRGNSWTKEDPTITTLDALNELIDKLDPDTASSSSSK